MDSGCSKHMTGDIKNFLSLKTLQEGGVSFGDGKKGVYFGCRCFVLNNGKEFLGKFDPRSDEGVLNTTKEFSALKKTFMLFLINMEPNRQWIK